MQFSLCLKRFHPAVILITLFLVQLSCLTVNGFAQEETANSLDAISAYQRHRQEFIAEQVNADKSYSTQVSTLKAKIEKLKQDNQDLDKQQKEVQVTISERKQSIESLTGVQNWAAAILFPMLSIISSFGTFVAKNSLYIALVFFLSLTVLNVFFYIRFKEATLFNKYKMPLIVAVVVLIVSIASPLLADDQNKRDQVISKLDSAEKILSRSDYERFIAILEAKPLPHIKLPDLQSGNPLFKVYPEVDVDSPEYWYTLAALYTHAQENGNAIAAIQKIIDSNKLQKTPEHQEIIINSIKFFLREGQTQQISTAVDSLAKTSLSVPTLLEISILLKQNGMQTSSEKTLSYAITSANSVNELIELIQYFNKQQEREKSDEALLKAIPKVRTLDEVLSLTETTIISGKDLLIGKLIDTADKVLTDYREKMQVVDLFLKYNRKEDAVHFISRIIKSNSTKSEKNIEALLYITDACMERNFLPQATSATEALIAILTFNKAKDFPMNLQNTLRASIGLPDEKSIMLTQFYGMINEEQGLNDKAEEAYIRSVLNSLSIILESYGYTFPPSLNDFYLLGRIWVKANRQDLIVQLDRVYSSIEEQFIKQQSLRNETQLSELQKEIDQLQSQSQHLKEDLKHTKHESLRVMMKLWTHALSTIATIVFIIAALAGCVVIARRYSTNLSMGKTFGFAIKLWETTGWLQMLSVLGVISGLLSVIFSQLLLIFQTIQENTHKALYTHFLPNSSLNGELAHEKTEEAALQVEHDMIYDDSLKKEATL